MANIAEFIYSLATKAGVPQDNQALKDLVANPDIQKVNITEDIEKSIYSTWMTADAAKNNPAIKAHFFAAALDGVDRNMEKVLEAYNLSEEEKAAYKEKSTYARIDYVTGLIKAKEAEKVNAAGGEKKALVEEVQKLQGLLTEAQKSHQKALEEAKTTFTTQLSDLHYDNFLSTFQWGNKEIPADVHKITTRTLVDEELKKRNAVRVWDGQKFVLKNAASPDLDYMDGANKVEFNDFVTKVAAEKKLIMVTDPNTKPAPTPQPTPIPQPMPGNGTAYNGSGVFESMKGALKGAQTN